MQLCCLALVSVWVSFFSPAFGWLEFGLGCWWCWASPLMIELKSN